MKKRWLSVLVILCMLGLVSACGEAPVKSQAKNNKPQEVSVDVYVLNTEGNYLSRIVRETKTTKEIPVVLIEQLIRGNEELFPEKTKVLAVNLDDTQATVNFSEELRAATDKDLMYITEMCAMTLATKTPELETIQILIEGNPIAGMLEEPFPSRLVDYVDEMNTQIAMMNLYFPNPEGTALVSEYRLLPAEDISPYTLSVQQLIAGTEDPERKTNILPEDTEVLSVKVEDRLCTLDLSSAFLYEGTGGSSYYTMALYSVVATLTSFEDIDQVQILVNGDEDIAFGEFDLSEPFSNTLGA